MQCFKTFMICVCVWSVCLSVAAVNQAVKENRVNQTLRVLSLPEVQLQGLKSVCAADYQRELYNLITDRIQTGTDQSQTGYIQVLTSHRLDTDRY